METLNKIYGGSTTIEKDQEKPKIVNNTKQFPTNSINEQLEKLFGLQNKESTYKRETLSEESEVNTTEYKLAKIFGKEKEMIQLNGKKPLSIEGVLSQLENMYS